jgi:hypothetical protein
MKRASERRDLAVALLFATALGLQTSSGAETNEASIVYSPLFRPESSQPSEVLIDRFLEEMVASDSIVFDHFAGPASRLHFSRKENNLGGASIDRFNSEGASMFATIGVDSLRTAALEVLPLEAWADHWGGWVSQAVTGTLGNSSEEHVQLTSITYSAIRSSWEQANENVGIQWGIRPWRTSPYVYFLAHAGHADGQPLITFEGRARYTLFGDPRLEARLALQLPGAFRLAAAGSVDPTLFGTHDPDLTHISITLERVIRSRNLQPDSVFYIGFRSGVNRDELERRQENMMVMGFATRW